MVGNGNYIGIGVSNRRAKKEEKPVFHKSLVDCWNFKGKNNFDKDRNTIKGVKGNILNAYNFGWSLGSGYGKYTMNYLNYLNNSKSPEDIIITDSSITRLKGEGKISFWVTGNKLPTGITVIPSYRINVTGEWETPPEFTYYDGDNASISHTITLTHGINIIPEITINVITSISSTIYGFSTFQNGDVTIEQIPEYEGAIVTDGVDDYLKCDSSIELSDYTVIAKRHYLGEQVHYACFASTRNPPDRAGAFAVELTMHDAALDGFYAYSFGASTFFNTTPVNGIVYQTKTSYNENTISSNTNSLNNIFYLGVLSSNYTSYCKVAIEWIALYNRSLTQEEIQKEIIKINSL